MKPFEFRLKRGLKGGFQEGFKVKLSLFEVRFNPPRLKPERFQMWFKGVLTPLFRGLV